jgi:hypothetical protein
MMTYIHNNESAIISNKKQGKKQGELTKPYNGKLLKKKAGDHSQRPRSLVRGVNFWQPPGTRNPEPGNPASFFTRN